MKKKSEFSELAESIDEKFKALEKQKKRAIELQKKTVRNEPEISKHELNMKLEKESRKFEIYEKKTIAKVVFIGGHLILIPLYINHSSYFFLMFVFASFSLAIICLAVFDYYR